MLSAVALYAIEGVINQLIKQDAVTQANLLPLANQTLRVTVVQPDVTVDIIFSAPATSVTGSSRSPRIRLELPNSTTDAAPAPHCTLKAQTLTELLKLALSPEGNIPLQGDYKVLMNLQKVIAGYQPNLAGQLQPLIGSQLAGYLDVYISQLQSYYKKVKPSVSSESTTGTDTAAKASNEPANAESSSIIKPHLSSQRPLARMAGNLAGFVSREEFRSLNQRNRDLQIEVERLQAKLEQLTNRVAETQQRANQPTRNSNDTPSEQNTP